MVFRQVTLRQRLFHGAWHAASDPAHGHWHEYLVEFLYIVCNLAFVVGSICFFEGVSVFVLALGDWLFIFGSLLTVALCGYTIHEQRLHHKHETAKFNEADSAEVRETWYYTVASTIFAGGCIFFMPGLFTSERSERIAHEIGAWLFVAGSFGLVMASYYNALGMASRRAKEMQPHRHHFGDDDFHIGDREEQEREKLLYSLHCTALGLTQIGSVLFTCGSFMYRPALGNNCGEDALSVMNHPKWDSAGNMGASLYLVGSLAFLAQSILHFIIGLIKHDEMPEDANDGEELEPLNISTRQSSGGKHVKARRQTTIDV